MSRTVRVAAAQYAPRLADVDANTELAVTWIAKAADAGAQLVVLPELATSGYVFETEDEAQASAQDLANGKTVEAINEVCKERDIYAVFGINLLESHCRYNSAILTGPTGVVTTYSKLHLFYNEKNWFTPGNDLCLDDLPFGKVGIMICYDLSHPELSLALARGGAELICLPTNWVDSFKRKVYDERGYCRGNIQAMAMSSVTGCPFVCADRIGEERNVKFLGASMITDSYGWPAAGPASKDGEELLVADLDLDLVKKAQQRTPRNNLFEDRREDVYGRVAVR